MKKSDLFKIGVLLMATTLGTTGCSFGEDEKKPEIVVDPAEKTIEYYIAGKVTEGTTALSGVEVKAGEVTATTDAEGAYKLTVDSKKVYTVTFSKEGYMSIDNATATIADNAANRSMVSLSVKLSKKAPEKEVKADAEEEVVVTDKGDSNISQAEVAVIIPPKAIETTTTVSVTPYEEPAAVTTTVTPGNNVETPVAIANIEVETAKEVTLAKQDNPFKPEWFVSGGINGVTALNGSANNILGGKVSGGVWLNKIIGLRVDAEAGNVWLKGGYNAVTVGAGADILVNLMKNYTDEDRKFRLNAIFGLGYNYYSFGDDYPRLSKTNTMSGNFSLQAAFRLNSHLSIFAEPGIKISTKFYDIENKDDVFAGGMMTVGVIYKF